MGIFVGNLGILCVFGCVGVGGVSWGCFWGELFFFGGAILLYFL